MGGEWTKRGKKEKERAESQQNLILLISELGRRTALSPECSSGLLENESRPWSQETWSCYLLSEASLESRPPCLYPCNSDNTYRRICVFSERTNVNAASMV